MDNSDENRNDRNLTGLFTLICKSGKPYHLIMDNDTLQRLAMPVDLSPEDVYYVWLERVRPEDRSTVERAVRDSVDGLAREVRFAWRHDIFGWVNFEIMGILTEKSNEQLTIRGFFKDITHLKSETAEEESKGIALLKTILMDEILEGFSVSALTDIKTNQIFFLRDNIRPDNPKSSLTYDEWREQVLESVFSDDADKYRRMSARQKMSEYFDKYDNEYQIEVRCRNPVTGKFHRMKQRYMRFEKPLAGKFGEFIVFAELKADNSESYKESMHRRLIDGMVLPYREVDLINLHSGRAYSSVSKQGQYSDSFEEIGRFDDRLINYLAQCELTEEQRADNLDKFLTRNLVRHFSDGKKLLESELRHKYPSDEDYEWVRVQAFQSAADEERKPYMAILTVMPINEEKERALRGKQMLEIALRSERQYKKAILSTAMAVYTYNVTADILYEEVIEQEDAEPLLPKLGLTLPCSFNEYISRKSSLITSEQEAEFFRKTFNTKTLLDMFDSKRYTFDNEYEFMSDGKTGVFREAVFLTRDLETNEVWGLTTVRDVTRERNDTKRIEQALRDAFHQAQNASNAKTLFMSQMSHDIRTPLNSILGMASIAREHIDDRERLLECIDKIDFAGRHLLEIINNVLDLSAIESGKTVLTQEDFELKAFLDETVNMVLPQAGKRGQTIEKYYGDVYNNVSGDRTKLRQLLLNVLSNAVKYTPKGGKIRLSMEEIEMSKHDVHSYRFTVEDNGIGMPKEFIEKIFDPFSRVDRSRIGNVQGTGLGMAIAKNIARMMNGNICVKSEVGKGSVFEITVCLNRSQKQHIKDIGDIKLEEPKRVRMSDYDFGGRRVLLAEDLEFNAEIAVEFLSEAGLKVEHAANGARAVEMFANSTIGYYDLIFMDIQMPELDGNDAAKQIRALDREDAPSIPIIAMTANAFADDIRIALESGMNGHIAKPIEIPKLVQTLVDIFGNCLKKEKQQ